MSSNSSKIQPFSTRRLTNEELLMKLKHHPTMASRTVVIVISALKAIKSSSVIIQKAIRRFLAAVRLIQRMARRWYHDCRRQIFQVVERWVTHESDVLQNSASVPVEGAGQDIPVFLSGHLRYRIVRDVYLERRSAFRKRFKTWKRHLNSMEVERQMLVTAIDKLFNRNRVENEDPTHRIVSPKQTSMIRQSLKERHSMLIANMEKERLMLPIFDFSIQFSELRQRAILYYRTDASLRIKSAMDRLGIIPRENKIIQQRGTYFGDTSAFKPVTKKRKNNGNNENTTGKSKIQLLLERKSGLISEMEDRYEDLTGSVISASLSTNSISPPRRTRRLIHSKEELLVKSHNERFMSIPSAIPPVGGFGDAFSKNSSDNKHDVASYQDVMQGLNIKVEVNNVVTSLEEKASHNFEGSHNNFFITGVDTLACNGVESREEGLHQKLRTVDSQVDNTSEIPSGCAGICMKDDEVMNDPSNRQIRISRIKDVIRRHSDKVASGEHLETVGTNWGSSATFEDFGTSLRREFQPIYKVPRAHKLLNAVDIITEMEIETSLQLAANAKAAKQPLRPSTVNKHSEASNYRPLSASSRVRHVDVGKDITQTVLKTYPRLAPQKNIPRKRIPTWELERLTGFYPYFTGRYADNSKLEADGDLLSKFEREKKEAIRLRSVSQAHCRPTLVEWGGKKKDRIVIRKDRMTHWKSSDLHPTDAGVHLHSGKESHDRYNSVTDTCSDKMDKNSQFVVRKRAPSSEFLKEPIQTVTIEKSGTSAITCLEVLQTYPSCRVEEFERCRASGNFLTTDGDVRMKRTLFKASNTVTCSLNSTVVDVPIMKESVQPTETSASTSQTGKDDIVLIATGSIYGTLKIIAHPSGEEVFCSSNTLEMGSITNLVVVRGSSSITSYSHDALYEGDVTTLCYVSDDSKINILKRAPETMPVMPYFLSTSSSQHRAEHTSIGIPWDAEWWIHATVTMPCTPTCVCLFTDLLAVGGYDCKTRFIPIDYYAYLKKEEVRLELEKQKKAELALIERQQKLRAQAAKARNRRKSVGEEKLTHDTDEIKNQQDIHNTTHRYNSNLGSFLKLGSSNSLRHSSSRFMKEPGDGNIFTTYGSYINSSPLRDGSISSNIISSSEEIPSSTNPTGLYCPGMSSPSSRTSTVFCGDSHAGNDDLFRSSPSQLVKEVHRFVKKKKARYIAKYVDLIMLMVLEGHDLAITKIISWGDTVVSAGLDSNCFVFKINHKIVTEKIVETSSSEKSIATGFQQATTTSQLEEPEVVSCIRCASTNGNEVRKWQKNQMDDNNSSASVTQSKSDSSINSYKAIGDMGPLGTTYQQCSDFFFKHTEMLHILELESARKFTGHNRSILDLVRVGNSGELVCTASSDMTVCIWSTLVLEKLRVFTFNNRIICPIIVMPPKINKSLISNEKKDNNATAGKTSMDLDINIILCLQNGSVFCCSALTGLIVCDIQPDILSDICLSGTPLSSSCVALGTYGGRIILLNTDIGLIVGSRVVQDGSCNVLRISPHPHEWPLAHYTAKDDSGKMICDVNGNPNESIYDVKFIHEHTGLFKQLKPLIFSGTDTRKHGAHIIDMKLIQSTL